MRVKQVKVAATINLGEYSDIRPEITVDINEEDDVQQAKQLALDHITQIWQGTRNKQLEKNTQVQQESAGTTTFNKQVCIASGTEVLFDEANHVYQSGWLSGSTFAHLYEQGFAKEPISAKMASKYAVEQQDILNMWSTNAEASSNFGTGLHAALELYGRYLGTSKAVSNTDEKCLNKNPILKALTKEFYEAYGFTDAVYEGFVANEEYKICGFIDRLEIIDRKKKIVRVQDYKTNSDILAEKKLLAPFKKILTNDTLGYYSLQLSFYAFILSRAGYTVEGLDIFWPDLDEFLEKPAGYTTCWKKFSLDVVDIESEIKKTRS